MMLTIVVYIYYILVDAAADAPTDRLSVIRVALMDFVLPVNVRVCTITRRRKRRSAAALGTNVLRYDDCGEGAGPVKSARLVASIRALVR